MEKDSMDEQKPQTEFLLIPENQGTQLSDSQFELNKNELLVYFKFVTMNNKAIKNRRNTTGGLTNIVGTCQGYYTFGNIQELRSYFHGVLDSMLDEAFKTVNDA